MPVIERRINRYVRALAIGALLLAPIKGSGPNSRAAGVDALQKVDCSHGEAVDKTHPYDLIAVFGAGLYTDAYGYVQPNSSQLARMKAAASAYTQGYASKIILLDGGEGEALDASIVFLRQQVKELSEGKMELPDNAIYYSLGDINTATNAASLKRFVDEKGLEKVVSITDSFHAERAEIFACNYGVNSKMITVEEMGVQSSLKSSLYLAAKEYIEIALIKIDPLGDIPTVLKRLTKPAARP